MTDNLPGKKGRVAGHTLPHEGRVYVNGHLVRDAFGKCSCGKTSRMPLPNPAARQRWHRAHKAEVLSENDPLMREAFAKLADEWDAAVPAEEVLAMLQARIEQPSADPMTTAERGDTT